jgi:hypothetical protein
MQHKTFNIIEEQQAHIYVIWCKGKGKSKDVWGSGGVDPPFLTLAPD